MYLHNHLHTQTHIYVCVCVCVGLVKSLETLDLGSLPLSIVPIRSPWTAIYNTWLFSTDWNISVVTGNVCYQQ